jgi:hypothetical protein
MRTPTSFPPILGDGAGSFVLQQNIDLGPGNLKGEMAVGDFNEDGNPVVAFPQNGTEVLQPLAGSSALIFFGDGTGSLLAGPVLTVGTAPHSVITADFNKDIHMDLAVSNRTDGTVSIFLGDGSGNLACPPQFRCSVLPVWKNEIRTLARPAVIL